MNINFELYKVFYTVATCGNITKAANELMISQPAISKSIKNLEEQLGGDLFIRTKRGVVLTEEGKEFYQYIKQAMEFITNAENKFSDLINLEIGTIRIGISSTLTKQFLFPYLEKFHKLYPKINIQINTNLSTELFSKLRDGLIDIIILNLPCQKTNDIVVKEIKSVQDCFIVGDAYKDLTKRKIKLEEINNYPLILQAKGATTRKFLDNFLDNNNIVINPYMELTSYSLVLSFVKIGFGIGYATEDYMKKELADKEIYKLDVIPSIPSRKLGYAYLKNSILNSSTKKLISLIVGEEK